MKNRALGTATIVALLLGNTQLLSAQVITTEEKFQDFFISASYGTMYGAALGSALLSFQTKPEKNLRLVALGASVGFICGSLLGSYLILSPSIEVATHEENPDSLALKTPSASQFSEIRSVWTISKF